MLTQPQTMTESEWIALGERLFGADKTAWRFKCPMCGHVASVQKARALPETELTVLRDRQWAMESECVGRHLAGVGCDWAAYGLFSGPFFVVRESGRRTPVFGFDARVA